MARRIERSRVDWLHNVVIILTLIFSASSTAAEPLNVLMLAVDGECWAFRPSFLLFAPFVKA